MFRSRISLSQYRKILKELRQQFQRLGYEMRLYRRNIIWHRWGDIHPNFGEIKGNCSALHKKATITSFGKNGRRAILKTIAHELRHAIHAHHGLFKDYYRLENEIVARGLNRGQLPPDNYKLPSRSIATRAERDCDRWANHFLMRHQIAPKYQKPYMSECTGISHNRTCQFFCA